MTNVVYMDGKKVLSMWFEDGDSHYRNVSNLRVSPLYKSVNVTYTLRNGKTFLKISKELKSLTVIDISTNKSELLIPTALTYNQYKW